MLIDARALELINDGMGFRLNEAPMVNLTPAQIKARAAYLAKFKD